MHFFIYRFLTPVHRLVEVPQMAACYRRHEGEKRRAYKQRVREVEQGSFTPLVFSTSGGMGRAATVMYKIEASLPPILKTRATLQHGHGLAQMLPILLSAEISSDVPQRL